MLTAPLYIAGVCHQDPKGKANLKGWLRALRADNDGPPAFVGLEYNENKFAEIKKQRPMLRKKVKSMCPRASSDLLDALEQCLAYEPDAVGEEFPNVEPLWLMKGTSPPIEDLYDCWVGCYKRYYNPARQVSSQEAARVGTEQALTILSEAAWAEFKSYENRISKGLQIEVPDPEQRDKKFACLVREKIDQVSGGWAIVIVGANHASNNVGRMRYRLTAAGIKCKVDLIKTNGPVPA